MLSEGGGLSVKLTKIRREKIEKYSYLQFAVVA
jgi:hypothetical protein